MARFYPAREGKHRDFIAVQKLFFTASGTSDSRLNLSPKGMDRLRVLADNQVVYLDLTSSQCKPLAVTQCRCIPNSGERETLVRWCAGLRKKGPSACWSIGEKKTRSASMACPPNLLEDAS